MLQGCFFGSFLVAIISFCVSFLRFLPFKDEDRNLPNEQHRCVARASSGFADALAVVVEIQGVFFLAAQVPQ